MKNAARQLAGVLLLILASLVIGLLINAFRSPPLHPIYFSPEQRLKAVVAKLKTDSFVTSGNAKYVPLAFVKERWEKRQALILDARPSVFYQMGHLPGAWSLSREAFEADYLKLHSKLESYRSKSIIVYCTDPNCHDSEWVAQALLELGYKDVSFFSGGYAEWKQAELPIELK